jgi:hypothetical protein
MNMKPAKRLVIGALGVAWAEKPATRDGQHDFDFRGLWSGRWWVQRR